MKDPKQGSAFTEGRGPGRGMDIKRDPPKEHRRGIGNGDPLEIDLANLDQPGKGPVNFHMQRGRMVPSFSKNKPEGQPEDPLA